MFEDIPEEVIFVLSRFLAETGEVRDLMNLFSLSKKCWSAFKANEKVRAVYLSKAKLFPLQVKPQDLSVDVISTLIALKVPFPKYWIECSYKNHYHSFPPGSLERIVAHGYKVYGESLILIQDSVDLAFKNDSYLLKECMKNPQNQLDLLHEILHKNLFYPSLDTDLSKEDWQSIFNGLFLLCCLKDNSKKNSAGCKLAFVASSRCGEKVFKEFNHHLMLNILRIQENQMEIFKKSISAGFHLDPKTVVEYLRSFNVPLKDGETVIDPSDSFKLLKNHLSRPVLLNCCMMALRSLLSSNDSSALRTIDQILTFFQVPEDVVGRALIVNPSDILSSKRSRGYILPMLTVFGLKNGGITDPFWSFLSSRYTASHPFVEACLIDILVGGIIVPSSVSATLADHDSSAMLSNSLSTITGMLSRGINGFGTVQVPILGPERESATLESLEILLNDLKVPVTPLTLSVISNLVLSQRSIRSYQLAYMCRVEKYIMSSSCHPDARNVWIQSLISQILDHPDWISIQKVEDYSKPDSKPPTSRSMSMIAGMIGNVTDRVAKNLDLIDSVRLQDVRRFYLAAEKLMELCRASLFEGGDKSVDLGIALPFEAWRMTIANNGQDSVLNSASGIFKSFFG